MKNSCGFLTMAIFLSFLAGPGWAQKDAGIPPMLETQRPLATPTAQPEPRPPQVDQAKPVSSATKVKKAKKAPPANEQKTKVAGQKKTGKPIKKKGATAKTKGKVAANR